MKALRMLESNAPTSALVLCLAVTISGTPVMAHEAPEYEHEVRPIFAQRCGGSTCHINQAASGVDLTTYESTLASVGAEYGTRIVLPGDSAGSPLVDKILWENPTHGTRMPSLEEPLQTWEVDTIVDWIESGAIRTSALQRGDHDRDGELVLADAVQLLNFLFRRGPAVECELLSDANGDGETNIADPVFVLVHLFVGGPEPAFLTEQENAACQQATSLSFGSIYEKVLSTSCAFSSCHSAAFRKADLSLATLDEAWEGLVGKEPFNQTAREAGMLRVDAGRPENSFLLTKLIGPGPGEGNRMPSNSPTGLSEATVSAIREWIAAGAPKEGWLEGVPDITDDPPPLIERMPVPLAPEPGTGVQLRFPFYSIAPGSERQLHYFVGRPFQDLGLDEIIVNQIDVHMMEQSHHFILYKWIAPDDPRAGFRPGSNASVSRLRNIVTSQQSYFSLSFPEGVGLQFDKNDAFDLNSHYVNLNSEHTLLGEAYVNIFFAEPGTVDTIVKPIFDFGGDIWVPPNQTTTAAGIFPSGVTLASDPGLGTIGRVSRETHIYALTSHTHRHGVRFTGSLYEDLQPLETPQMIFDNYSWDDPEFVIYDPPLVLQPDQGIFYEATYSYDDPPSASSPPLGWGVTSEDEMIILLGYYATP